MSTVIRPELSKSNKYWIEKHRYYELKHFCLQYYFWKHEYEALTNCVSNSWLAKIHDKDGYISNPVNKNIDLRMYYLDRIEMVENAAKRTDTEIGDYILVGVTKGVPYDYLKSHNDIPCSKETYYDLYRRFFWILNEMRK